MTGTGKHVTVRAQMRRAACAVGLGALALLVAIATPAAGRPRGLIWSGDFSSGKLSKWFWVQACPGSVRVVRNPLQVGPLAVRITVTDADLHPSCPRLQAGPDPSAFLVSPPLFRRGQDLYVGFAVYFPHSFPAVRSPRWLQVAEIYGRPFAGGPQISVGVRGNRLVLVLLLGPRRRYTVAWGTPLRRGSWHHVVMRVKFSPDPSDGSIRLWHNGRRQTLWRRQRTIHLQTLVPGVTWSPPGGANALYLDLYRAPGLGSVTVYESKARVGRTYRSVAG